MINAPSQHPLRHLVARLNAPHVYQTTISLIMFVTTSLSRSPPLAQLWPWYQLRSMNIHQPRLFCHGLTCANEGDHVLGLSGFSLVLFYPARPNAAYDNTIMATRSYFGSRRVIIPSLYDYRRHFTTAILTSRHSHVQFR